MKKWMLFKESIMLLMSQQRLLIDAIVSTVNLTTTQVFLLSIFSLVPIVFVQKLSCIVVSLFFPLVSIEEVIAVSTLVCRLRPFTEMTGLSVEVEIVPFVVGFVEEFFRFSGLVFVM